MAIDPALFLRSQCQLTFCQSDITAGPEFDDGLLPVLSQRINHPIDDTPQARITFIDGKAETSSIQVEQALETHFIVEALVDHIECREVIT
ncbi:hypothetical protein D3C76_1720410 [compost metagenome]